MKPTLPKKTIALAVLSAGVYLCLRLVFHAQIQGAGYVDGGLISYDSYYHFAFARELNRTGNSLLFQNPFGTLDKAPLLFNLYSSFLSLIPHLSIPTLFIFDCVMGTLFIGLTSFCIIMLMPSLGTIENTALLFGGSVAFTAACLGYVSESDAVFAAYWGLTYLLNQISTPEIVYHFFVFFGLYGLLHRNNLIVLSVTGILTFLHPFTSMIFNAALFFAWLHRWSVTRRILNDRADVLLYAFLSVALSTALFGFLLPAASKDALYFKVVYEKSRFYLDIRAYALFLICPASFLFGSLLFGARTLRSSEDSEKLWVFAGVSLFCILLTTSYLYTDRVVQPAHWSRAYPYVLFFGISSLMQGPKLSSPSTNAWRSLKLLLLTIALMDSALGLAYIRSSLFAERRPPLFLSQGQAQVILLARDLAPGRFLYLRDSSNNGVLGDIEYAMMALTPQKGFLGHAFFSPFLRSMSDVLYPGRHGFQLPHDLVQQSDYLLLDRSLFDLLPSELWETIYRGKELVLVMIPRGGTASTNQKDQPVRRCIVKGFNTRGKF